MTETIIHRQDTYALRRLSGGDEATLQDLCRRCTDFFQLHEGRPPEENAGHDILFDLPPDKGPEDKFVLGVYNENGVLIAVMDLVRDYKVPGEWMLGLMMIDPDERGNGLGRQLHEFIGARVSEKHGRLLRIGVVEDNIRGYRFWREMGYVETGRVQKNYGNKRHTVIVMNLSL